MTTILQLSLVATLFLAFTTKTAAQSIYFGSQQIISVTASGANSVYASDINGDGNINVLSASRADDRVDWYLNDGSGNLGSKQNISSSANDARSVYAADIDGDGNIDVLSASFNDDKIAWYQNNGSGNFVAEQIISSSANGANSVYATDIDGDGDMDVLSASINDDKIAWYQNDGSGNFGLEQIISSNADKAACVYAADIDGDGDMDVLSASINDDKIAWYQNDGSGNFGTEQIISSNADKAYSVYAIDIDGDGDMDVLSASSYDHKIAWYENDGLGNFGAEQIISSNADGAYSVYAADLDNDGDIDVLSASLNDDKIVWYENIECAVNINEINGNSSPGAYETVTYVVPNTTGSTYNWVTQGGAISSGNGTNTVEIMWNTSGIGNICVTETDVNDCTTEVCLQIDITLSVNKLQSNSKFNISPNPSNGIVKIQDVKNASIEIINNAGKTIKNVNSTNNNMELDLSQEPKGIYFVKVITADGVTTQKLILE